MDRGKAYVEQSGMIKQVRKCLFKDEGVDLVPINANEFQSM